MREIVTWVLAFMVWYAVGLTGCIAVIRLDNKAFRVFLERRRCYDSIMMASLFGPIMWVRAGLMITCEELEARDERLKALARERELAERELTRYIERR